MPADNIILMMQDDVANSSENPFPGQLFNKPGENPPDVYKGCKVDYSGDIVTGKLFMDVLTGNTEGAKGKVLKSGASDTVRELCGPWRSRHHRFPQRPSAHGQGAHPDPEDHAEQADVQADGLLHGSLRERLHVPRPQGERDL